MNAAETSGRRVDWEVWVRRTCALIVAAVAAYGSYEHQRVFAVHGGADDTSAALWPLSVDGLLVLATISLLKSTGQTSRRARVVIWATFGLGIAVSLAANIAAAPKLAWQPMLVAGWPPVALLLAVELLTHRSTGQDPQQPEQRPAETVRMFGADNEGSSETVSMTGNGDSRQAGASTAEEIMWEYYQRERSRGRVPTGAELDRVAGTRDYGRSVLRRWRDTGRVVIEREPTAVS